MTAAASTGANGTSAPKTSRPGTFPRGGCLLDSSVVIEMIRGNRAVTARTAALPEVWVCPVALGELYAGAVRSGRPAAEVRKIRRALFGVRRLTIGPRTARAYARVKATLLAAGAPIPENDLWIAATAVRCRLTLVTHDAHFTRVAGLRTQIWPK